MTYDTPQGKEEPGVAIRLSRGECLGLIELMDLSRLSPRAFSGLTEVEARNLTHLHRDLRLMAERRGWKVPASDSAR